MSRGIGSAVQETTHTIRVSIDKHLSFTGTSHAVGLAVADFDYCWYLLFSGPHSSALDMATTEDDVSSAAIRRCRAVCLTNRAASLKMLEMVMTQPAR